MSATQGYTITCQPRAVGEVEIGIQGEISLATAASLLTALEEQLTQTPRLYIDLAQVDYLDAAGAAILLHLQERCRQKGGSLQLAGAQEKVAGFLQIAKKVGDPPAARREEPLFEQIGRGAVHLLHDLRHSLAFAGELVSVLLSALSRPGRIRWRETLYAMERVGCDAVPIVLLINFLIGLIMAFQSALQLKQFGANIFVANLVALSMVRELGPLMTAFIIAGRSGASFAAEIGTMKVSEEVDALVTMGFDPMRFLVVPKVLALLLMLPCLTIFADLVGIIGGGLIGISVLDLTVFAYVNQTAKAMGLLDISAGLIKSIIFAVLIAGVGCMRGFEVRGGAESVGRYTTSAVVSGIFLIILADAVCTMVAHFLPTF